jgi:tetratricopeptide (TPR) repeat protein
MKIALAMIVKGDDREAWYLQRCLNNMSKHVDGIYITITHRAGEEPNAEVKKVAAKYDAEISYFEWVDDFAAARNFNFKQVPKEYDYIMWSDADDIWRGLEKLKPTIADHPQVDAFGFWYLYDWDEEKKPIVVHKKSMVVRNDDCVEWVGALHEEFEGNRALDTFMVTGIDRLHLSEDPVRHDENARRNLGIAEKQAEIHKDDPRSYWNLANAQYGVAEYDKAIESFTHFLKESESDEEKYVAHTRLADVYKSVGRSDDAIRELHLCIGLRPYIPDAYLQLAYLYYSLGNFDKAEEYCLQGMLRKPQIHKMIVFNPRDYDYNPMMLAAQIYYQKNRPDKMLPFLKGCLKIYPNDEGIKKMIKDGTADKRKLARALYKVRDLQRIKSKDNLKKAIAKLSPDLQSHPAVAVIRNNNFQKEESSGRDLVIYCGQTGHEWFDGAKGFIGGSEEAVINLARELSKLEWNVTVYNNCGHKERMIGGVRYVPFWMFNYRDKQDVVILWRWCKPLDAEINAPKIFVDLHDVIPKGELNERRLQKVTKVMVKSAFHRSLFPNVPDDKIAVIPNGIDLSLLTGKAKRDPMLVINTSSPDRSMDVLPKLWEEVKKQVPKAKMKWAYGWEIFKRSYADDAKKLAWMRDVQRKMKEAGIEDLGRLSQAEIGKLYQKASFLAYPTEFAEIDCISVRKAQAAGCMPITTDFAALNESVIWGVKVRSNKTKDTWNRPYQFHFGLEGDGPQSLWVEAMVQQLTAGAGTSHPMMAQFSWEATAARWDALL